MTVPHESEPPSGTEVEEERTLRGQPVIHFESAQLQRIPLNRLRPRADQPRRRMDARALGELTDSIRAHGVLQPIRVRPRDSGYEIIAGERRWRAAREAGLEEIPAIIVAVDDDRAYVEALIENIQREELNAVDRAQALKRLRVALHLDSWQEVGEMVGITRQHVYNLLNVTRLPAPIREDLRAGDLTEKHARALLRLQDHPQDQLRLWERIHRDKLSARAVDDAAKAVLGRAVVPPGSPADAGSDLGTLIDGVVAALMTAGPEELRTTRLRLVDLHRLLTEVLERL
jgi:ParB family transcriptional regulator, chromosome partitioning protein